jgi:hypothetical protein
VDGDLELRESSLESLNFIVEAVKHEQGTEPAFL